MKRFVFCFFLMGMVVQGCFAQFLPAGEEPVTLKTSTGDIYGKMCLPTVSDTYPVVLLISGSGPTDMDGNSAVGGDNNSLKYLAEGLANEGIASLRFDKRGIATSRNAGKNEADLRFDDYVGDVRAWVDLLANDKRVTGIYIAGHSEGSLVGMVAARNNKKVKGFISIAGAGRPADELIEEQFSGHPKMVREIIGSINRDLKAGRLVENVPMGFEALFRHSVQPYMISWYKYDPCEVIKKLKIPVLIVQGNTDIQVSVKDAEALHRSSGHSRYCLIENMNHVLKTCETLSKQEQMAFYTDPSIPNHPDLLPCIVSFIRDGK